SRSSWATRRGRTSTSPGLPSPSARPRSRRRARPPSACGSSSNGFGGSPRRATMTTPRRRGGRREALALIGCLALASGAAAERTLQDLAARDAVPQIARAIKAGEPVDAVDDEGRTALHVAAKAPHLFSAMMLLSKGADPNARDRSQKTPLHYAADGDAR